MDHHVIRELVAHGIAFLVAAGVGAAVLWHFYGFFEWNTESPSAALQAFLASVFIVGGLGPAITMMILWLHRRASRRRG